MSRHTPVQRIDPVAYQMALVNADWRDHAGMLAHQLAAGESPRVVRGMAAPNGEPVWLNSECDLLSWQARNVIPNERPVVAFGHPLFVTTALALGEAANSRERRRAEALSRPQWRSHGRVQVQVTPSATWLLRGGEWRSCPHPTVSRYELYDDGCTMQFSGGFPPVRLVGPAVWPHAVLLAYAQYGRGFLQAPYLSPLQFGSRYWPRPRSYPSARLSESSFRP